MPRARQCPTTTPVNVASVPRRPSFHAIGMRNPAAEHDQCLSDDPSRIFSWTTIVLTTDRKKGQPWPDRRPTLRSSICWRHDRGVVRGIEPRRGDADAGPHRRARGRRRAAGLVPAQPRRGGRDRRRRRGGPRRARRDRADRRDCRVAAATGNIVRALAVAIEVAEEEEQEAEEAEEEARR